MYVSSLVDALTTGVLLCQAKTAAVASVANRPTTERVTATIDWASLHLENSAPISLHSVRHNRWRDYNSTTVLY